MKNFKIDPQLAGDNTLIGELLCSQVLLMNNKKVPWFVLVPKVGDVSEIYELEKNTQQLLLEDINTISFFIKKHFEVDKLNVAAIGNIVKQLHVHVVGRNKNDCAWPGVVWGMQEHQAYTQEDIDKIVCMFDLYKQDNS